MLFKSSKRRRKRLQPPLRQKSARIAPQPYQREPDDGPIAHRRLKRGKRLFRSLPGKELFLTLEQVEIFIKREKTITGKAGYFLEEAELFKIGKQGIGRVIGYFEPGHDVF